MLRLGEGILKRVTVIWLFGRAQRSGAGISG